MSDLHEQPTTEQGFAAAVKALRQAGLVKEPKTRKQRLGETISGLLVFPFLASLVIMLIAYVVWFWNLAMGVAT